MIYGGILAGGMGTRMQSGGIPKQLICVGGVPVLIRTLKAFLGCHCFDGVLIAMNAVWRDYAERLINESGVAKGVVKIIEGGATRFESLINLSREIRRLDSDAVLVNHDCARPFVSRRILEDCISQIEDFDMVTTSIPTIDTVLVSADGKKSDGVPERSTIFLDQGPQVFRVNQFLDLVDSLTVEEKTKYMEAGRLYLDKGLSVGIVKGERTNFKLTTPFDLVVAEAMIKKGLVS